MKKIKTKGDYKLAIQISINNRKIGVHCISFQRVVVGIVVKVQPEIVVIVPNTMNILFLALFSAACLAGPCLALDGKYVSKLIGFTLRYSLK